MNLTIENGFKEDNFSVLALYRSFFHEKDKSSIDKLTRYFKNRLECSDLLCLKNDDKLEGYCSYSSFLKDKLPFDWTKFVFQLCFGPDIEKAEKYCLTELLNSSFQTSNIQKYSFETLQNSPLFFPQSEDIYLSELGVSEDCRRKGFGKKLVTTVLDQSKGKTIYTNARENSGSEQLFLSIGFFRLCKLSPWWENGVGSTFLCYNKNSLPNQFFK